MAPRAPQGWLPRKQARQAPACLTALFPPDLPSALAEWPEVGALLSSIGLVKLDLGSLVGLSEIRPAVCQLARLLQHWQS